MPTLNNSMRGGHRTVHFADERNVTHTLPSHVPGGLQNTHPALPTPWLSPGTPPSPSSPSNTGQQSGALVPVTSTPLPVYAERSPAVAAALVPFVGDLSSLLVHFPISWNFREDWAPAGLRSTPFEYAYAFESRKTACILVLEPHPTRPSEGWSFSATSQRGNALTVLDVVIAIGNELHSFAGPAGCYTGHPKEELLRARRRSRRQGDEDAATNTFRKLDLFTRRLKVFRGLRERWSPQHGALVYVVQLAG